jgi:hypothetical protein
LSESSSCLQIKNFVPPCLLNCLSCPIFTSCCSIDTRITKQVRPQIYSEKTKDWELFFFQAPTPIMIIGLKGSGEKGVIVSINKVMMEILGLDRRLMDEEERHLVKFLSEDKEDRKDARTQNFLEQFGIETEDFNESHSSASAGMKSLSPRQSHTVVFQDVEKRKFSAVAISQKEGCHAIVSLDATNYMVERTKKDVDKHALYPSFSALSAIALGAYSETAHRYSGRGGEVFLPGGYKKEEAMDHVRAIGKHLGCSGYLQTRELYQGVAELKKLDALEKVREEKSSRGVEAVEADFYPERASGGKKNSGRTEVYTEVENSIDLSGDSTLAEGGGEFKWNGYKR